MCRFCVFFGHLKVVHEIRGTMSNLTSSKTPPSQSSLVIVLALVSMTMTISLGTKELNSFSLKWAPINNNISNIYLNTSEKSNYNTYLNKVFIKYLLKYSFGFTEKIWGEQGPHILHKISPVIIILYTFLQLINKYW